MTSCPADEGRYCLTLACRSARGQVATVTALLERHGAYIEESAVFDDVPTERFYVRAVFRIRGATQRDHDALRTGYAAVLAGFVDAEGAIRDTRRPTRVLIMVSKADHCLHDLLAQRRRGELDMDVIAVVSNHPGLAHVAKADGLPFHHFPDHARDEAATGGTGAALHPRIRRRARGAGALHAGPVGRHVPGAGGACRQHPPLLPAGLQGSASL